MDRNQKAREEFEAGKMRQARQQFAQAVSSRQTGLIDRFGQLIEEGDLVLHFPPSYGTIFVVKSVGPDLNPAVRPGLMKVEIAATIPIQYQAGTRSMDLLKVGKQTEHGHSELAPPNDATASNDTEAASDPGAFVATDSSDLELPPSKLADIACDKCGDLAEDQSSADIIGNRCVDCGVGTYQLKTTN